MAEHKKRGGNGPPSGIAGSKRHKQMPLSLYFTRGDETPAQRAGAGQASAWPSTANRALAGLKLHSEQKHAQEHNPTKIPNEVTAAVTQGRQRAQSDDDGDDFVISQSQTYERTQPEPADGLCLGDQDPELSLRRTQPFSASEPTQPYGSHLSQQYSQLLGFRQGSADVWEADLTRDGSNVSLVPPCAIEGQGSNQPGPPPLLYPLGIITTTAGDYGGSARGVDPLLALLPASADARCTSTAVPAFSSGPAVTPELQGMGSGAACATDTDVQDDGTTPTLAAGCPGGDQAHSAHVPALHPFFFRTLYPARGKPQRTFLVRHGESEYNAACYKRSSFREVIDVFDARLTRKGKRQARDLRQQVEDLLRAHTKQHGEPLFVVSPLSRAIETFLTMLPCPERVAGSPASSCGALSPSSSPDSDVRPSQRRDQRSGSGAPESAGGGTSQQPSLASPAAKNMRSGASAEPLNIVFNPEAAEFLNTCGDVGRPTSDLSKDYPSVAPHLSRDLQKELWWYAADGGRKVNCAARKQLECTEPSAVAEARCNRFRNWLRDRPERFVIVVGHSLFFRHLTNSSHWMKNCEVMEYKHGW